MKFDELDKKMRVFETSQDVCVLPKIFMVARIDGRSFTRLTKETHKFQSPFDERVRDMMLATTEHLMNCGFRVMYGYTQSDEISLLFHRDEDSFGRKLRKFDSVLAGEASACFSLLLGAHAVFDARISQLPTSELVIDYFRWRHEDAHRNALNAHCYWALRKDGQSQKMATEKLLRLSVTQKNELLFQKSKINFSDLPSWQRRGAGVYWKEFEKTGLNPKTSKKTTATRRRLVHDLELPTKGAYSEFIAKLVVQAETGIS